MVKVLLHSGLLVRNALRLNQRNEVGFTALDLLMHLPRGSKQEQIQAILYSVGAKRAQDQSLRDLKGIDILNSLIQEGAMRAKDGNSLGKKTNDQISSEPYNSNRSNSKKSNWVRKKRNTIMVVASLIATMTFQAGVNLPGGVWQDNLNKTDSNGNPPHDAGTSIMSFSFSNLYDGFLIFNTVGFLASSNIILLLISGLPLKHRFLMWTLMVIMWIAIASMMVAYLISITTITPKDRFQTLGIVALIGIYIWFGLMGLLLLGNTIRIIYYIVRLLWKFGKFIKRMIRPSNSMMNRN
ncbi:hypothetical protein NE237_008526 [Protea cynaroides]|uniref:PGG domain-containing protein n=1 Tax=Protea cynaroides TaxID=273540 RepID=A0A9Q0KWN5_9MAGN|nr:hypothetical protein NE237_008526 [Protea cynaroides]